MERYPAGIGKKGFIQKDVSKGFPSWLERVEVEQRDAKEGGAVHYPLGERRAIAGLAREPELHHAARLDARACRTSHQPDLCVFDLDPPRRRAGAAAGGGAGGAGPARGARAAVVRQDVGFEGVPHRDPARRRDRLRGGLAFRPRRRRRAGQAAPGDCSPRSSSRPIARAASSSTPDATARAPRSRRSTPCGPSPGRPSRRPAPGRRSSATASARARSRCARCPTASRARSAICGATWPASAARCARRSPRSNAC